MDKDKLLKLEGYIFKREGLAIEEDMEYIQDKIIQLLDAEGFCYCGLSTVEDDD